MTTDEAAIEAMALGGVGVNRMAYTDMSDEQLRRLMDSEHARWPGTRWAVLDAVGRVLADRYKNRTPAALAALREMEGRDG